MRRTLVLVAIVAAHGEGTCGDGRHLGNEQILAVSRRIHAERKDSPTARRRSGAVKYTFFGMDFEVFALERLQSIWEHKVGWNLAESGVHPLRVEELVDREGDRQALMSLPLGYPQTNGTVELRASIASMYPGATPAHVLVTNGGSEANLVTLMHLVQPSDQVVVMMPNYMQVRGLGRALQAEVRHWTLAKAGRTSRAGRPISMRCARW